PNPRHSQRRFPAAPIPASRMRSPLDFAEDILREQLLEIDGRLGLADPAVRSDDPLRTAGADADVLLADQTLRLDRGDGVLWQLDAPIDDEHHLGLVVHEADLVDAPDLDPRDLHARTDLQAADRGEIRDDRVAATAEELDAAEFNRKISQCQDAQDHEDSDRYLDA